MGIVRRIRGHSNARQRKIDVIPKPSPATAQTKTSTADTAGLMCPSLLLRDSKYSIQPPQKMAAHATTIQSLTVPTVSFNANKPLDTTAGRRIQRNFFGIAAFDCRGGSQTRPALSFSGCPTPSFASGERRGGSCFSLRIFFVVILRRSRRGSDEESAFSFVARASCPRFSLRSFVGASAVADCALPRSASTPPSTTRPQWIREFTAVADFHTLIREKSRTSA